MGQIRELLAGHNLVMIDTCCFIYHIEAVNYPAFAPVVDELFTLVSTGKLKALTSPLTLTEILSHPRRLGLEEVACEYKLLLIHFPNLSLPPMDIETADKAASIKANCGLRTPDALQVATAVVHQASAFVTFDRECRKAAPVIRVILLSPVESV